MVYTSVPTVIVTVLPASAVPVISGVVSFVIKSSIVGASGGVASINKEPVPGVDTLSAASVAVALTV